jgi:hypothetical protein
MQFFPAQITKAGWLLCIYGHARWFYKGLANVQTIGYKKGYINNEGIEYWED